MFNSEVFVLFPESIDPSTIEVPHLFTIGYSHYCEVARWALERAEIPFREVQYAPGYHAKAIGQLRSDRDHRSQSSYVGEQGGAHGGRRKYAVPLVCLPDGAVLRDSWEIVHHAMGPTDPQWQQIMDEELGVLTRQIVYHYILTPAGKPLLRHMLSTNSIYERVLWLFVGQKVIDGMRQLMAITEDNVQVSQQRVVAIMERASDALREHGGALQSGGTFGATELAFCGLAAICLFPQNYANGAARLPPLEQFPADFVRFVQRCRQTEAGQYVLDCYMHKRLC